MPGTRGLAALLALVTLLMMATCFWPFDFTPRNGVTRLPDGGLGFDGGGIAFGAKPIMFPAGGGISIVALLRPRIEPGEDTPNIVTLAAPDGGEVSLGSWREGLIVRSGWRSAARPAEIGVGNALKNGRLNLVAVTSNAGGTAIYSEGALISRRTGFILLPSDREVSLWPVLGASPSGLRSWKGDLEGLAVYNRALMPSEVASAGEALREKKPLAPGMKDGLVEISIPAIFRPFKRSVLAISFLFQEPVLKTIFDIAQNTVGFVPFGFLLASLLRSGGRTPSGRAVLVSVMVGFFFSLGIELVQAFLPTRYSDATDVITNTLGCWIGASLSLLWF